MRQGIKYYVITDEGKRDAGCGLVIDVCDDVAYVLLVVAICKFAILKQKNRIIGVNGYIHFTT